MTPDDVAPVVRTADIYAIYDDSVLLCLLAARASQHTHEVIVRDT
jgi:hypothetical protein